jgi:hypothetical protein
VGDKVDIGSVELGAAPLLSVNDVTGPESGANGAPSTFNFVVRLSAASDKTVTVNAVTVPDTASANDFEPDAATLTFNPGETIKFFPVDIVNDNVPELDETFFVRLSDATNATIADGEGVGTIRNDDIPTLSITTDPLDIPFAGELVGFLKPVPLHITLSHPISQKVTVLVSLGGGTATPGVDYPAVSQEIDFDPGTTLRQIGIQVFNDDEDELNETFIVKLSNPINATISDGEEVITIIDDEGPDIDPFLNTRVKEGGSGSAKATFTVQNSGNTAAIVVNLAKTSVQDITVDFATANGTATAGSDYTAVSAKLTIPAGQTSGTISVPILDDTLSEPDETFVVNLSNPVNGFFANAQTTVQATVTILDDDAAPTPPPLLLSQFRENGPNGPTDEFVEIFNPTSSAHTVTGANGTGYGLFASAGNGTTSDTVKLVCVIPEGTVIAALGYFLCTGTGYSLGNLGFNGGAAGATAAGGDVANVSANMATGAADGANVDIPNDAGLALINVGTNIVSNTADGFAAAGLGSITVFDKVGFAAYGPAALGGAGRPPNASNFCETNCLQPVGNAGTDATCTATGPNFPAATTGGVCYGQSGQYTILRKQLFTTLANFRASGTIGQDTNNNTDDFLLLAPNPSANTGSLVTNVAGVTSIQGAASPHNGSAPSDAGTLAPAPFDSAFGQLAGPNAERSFISEDPASGPAGTFTLRLRYTNVGTRNLASPTGDNVVGGVGGGLRFRLDMLTTLCGAQATPSGNSVTATHTARNLRSPGTCQEGSDVFDAILKAVNSTGESLQDTSGTLRTVRGTVLEDIVVGAPAPGGLSPLGGGLNNSLVVTAASPGAATGTFSPGTIIPGDVMFVKFKFGVVKSGRFLVLFTPEASSSPTALP